MSYCSEFSFFFCFKNNYYIDMISRFANNGEIYNISDNFEISNIDLIKLIVKF